ncbi:MAG: MATE family efflux transporter [Clostridia bacterium]|nr:MATE family efflux transporter [Clostridia bacterium]
MHTIRFFPHFHFHKPKQPESDLTTGPFVPKIIKYTIPIILTSLLQLLFNATDLVVVGQTCGELYLGAVGSTGALINLMVNLFIGLSVGAGVAIAQGYGAKNDEDIHKTLHTAIPTAFIAGIFLTVVGILGARSFLTWMDTPEEVIDLSTTYLRIYFSGIIPILLYNYGSAILRAAGDTRSPLIFLTIAGILNVFINLLFVLQFGMDVDGVAWATVISQTLACILVLIELARRKDACRLQFTRLRFSKKHFLRILRVGLPAGLQGSLFSISNVMIQSSVNSFGTVVLSGSTAAANIEGFVWVSMNAFHQSAMNFIGQNRGAKKYDNIKKVLRICLISVSVAGIALGVICRLNAHALLSIYLTDAPEEAYQAGIDRMSFVCLPYFLCGIMDVMTGSLRGMGCSTPPMFITVLGVCGSRLLWIFTLFQLPEFHSLSWLMFSYPLSWSLTFFAELICFTIVWRIAQKKEMRDIGPPPDEPSAVSETS